MLHLGLYPRRRGSLITCALVIICLVSHSKWLKSGDLITHMWEAYGVDLTFVSRCMTGSNRG